MSVQFTASGDTLSRADTVIGATTARTMSVWVRKTTSSDNAFAELLYGAWATPMSTFAGDMFVGEASNVGSSLYSFTFTVNQWYHLVHVYDGTNYTVYKDGVLVAGPTAWSSAGGPAGTSWQFGQSNVELQDVCVYNAALSAAEAAQLFAVRRPRRTNNLVAYYPFFGGSNRNIDYSGNARTLTAAGTPADGADSAPAGWGGGEPRSWVTLGGIVQLVGSGGVQSAGAATVTVTKALAGAAGVASAGSATVAAQKDLAGAGGIQSAGSAAIAATKALAGSGGVQSAGSAVVTATKALVGAGGIQSSGFATLTGGGAGGGVIPALTVMPGRRGGDSSRRRIRW